MSAWSFAAAGQASGTLPERRIIASTFFLSGLLMQFNGYLAGVRYSDIFSIVMIIVGLFFAVRKGSVLVSLLVSVIIGWTILSISTLSFDPMLGDDRVWLMRCYTSLLFGAVFYFSTPHQRDRFAFGVVVGGVLGFTIAVLEAFGLGMMLVDLGLRSATAASRGLGSLDQSGLTLRVTGMWGDANELGPVGTLPIVASLYLVGRRGHSRIVFWISFACMSINALFLSFNRSGLISSIASILIYAMRYHPSRMPGILVRGAVISLLILVAAYFILPDAIEDLVARYSFEAALINIQGRLASFGSGILLISKYPNGLSSSIWPDYMRSMSWVANPHNAFVSTSFGAGILFALFSLVSFLYCIFSQDRFSSLLATNLFILFFFETLNFSPGFIYFLGIIWSKTIVDSFLAVSKIGAGKRSSIGRAYPQGKDRLN